MIDCTFSLLFLYNDALCLKNFLSLHCSHEKVTMEKQHVCNSEPELIQGLACLDNVSRRNLSVVHFDQ